MRAIPRAGWCGALARKTPVSFSTQAHSEILPKRRGGAMRTFLFGGLDISVKSCSAQRESPSGSGPDGDPQLICQSERLVGLNLLNPTPYAKLFTGLHPLEAPILRTVHSLKEFCLSIVDFASEAFKKKTRRLLISKAWRQLSKTCFSLLGWPFSLASTGKLCWFLLHFYFLKGSLYASDVLIIWNEKNLAAEVFCKVLLVWGSPIEIAFPKAQVVILYNTMNQACS